MLIPVIGFLVAFSAQSTQLAVQNNTPRSTTDACHVYLVDVGQGEQFVRELSRIPNPGEEQALALKRKYPDAERILGEFEAIVGEETLTTRSFEIPGTRLRVTVSVYYTDEMMASRGHSDSMNVALVVSSEKPQNAMTVENSVTSQISYTSNTDKIQLKTRTKIDGRMKVIGIECQARR